MTDTPRFDPYEEIDLTSETAFGDAVAEAGGQRTSVVLGANISHRNADWLFTREQIIVEHKQIEANLSSSEGFKRRELALRAQWAREGRADIFGRPHDWKAASRELLGLYKPAVERIVKSANKQIRATRERLGWPRGHGVLVLSNKSVKDINPLGMCLLLQTIQERSCSEIGGTVYIPNYYLDIPGSDLANIVWFPVYRHGGETTPKDMVEFVDNFGRAFFRTLDRKAPSADPSEEIAFGTLDADRILAAKPIMRPPR